MVHQCFILGVLWCHVLYLIKSLSHFQFVFVYGVWEYSHFIDFHVAVQLFQHHLLKRLSFLCSIYLPPLSRINWPSCVGLFLDSILFHWYIYIIIILTPHSFDYCSFVVLFEVWKGYASSFVLFPQDCSEILGLLWFHINFSIFVLVLWKMSWIFR